MKIALVLSTNVSHSPYIYNYIKIFEQIGIEFDIISWNKNNIAEKVAFSFDKYTDRKKSRIVRIKSYLEYICFVLNVLKKNNYDRIVLFTIPIGILLYPYLKMVLKKAYILDIRDYSIVLRFIPNFFIDLIIKHSFSVVISSPGFSTWLPFKYEYVISHNNNFYQEPNVKSISLRKNAKNEILTIGALRDYEANRIVIDSFKNNSYFSMKFVGEDIAYVPLVNYVNTNNIENVFFTGWYDKKDEVKYLKNVSLINIFMPNDINSKTLMSNRFYLAINNRIPVIVSADSTQAEYVQRFNLGVIVEQNDNIKSQVLRYIDNFDEDVFIQGTEEFLLEINLDQYRFNSLLLKFTAKNN
ncbi:glycosyltransferase family protein [Flavobacterium nackdongense]|uniref:Glycosyltransferase n=1 Tax=Flavobacterium nackdongense TaxID=2547394 RepID=A0A4P6Y9R0_9FLAO|nr:hypothetical protein [Flavobacterium nackdongense]QBN19801.1 hypothetical protein E1750_13650 [Flavobacterium nackdongense]